LELFCFLKKIAYGSSALAKLNGIPKYRDELSHGMLNGVTKAGNKKLIPLFLPDFINKP
jgi:hypothetical protein